MTSDPYRPNGPDSRPLRFDELAARQEEEAEKEQQPVPRGFADPDRLWEEAAVGGVHRRGRKNT